MAKININILLVTFVWFTIISFHCIQCSSRSHRRRTNKNVKIRCNNKYFSSDKVTAVQDGYCWMYGNHRFTMKSAANTCRKLHARLPALNTVAKTRAMKKLITASRKADPRGERLGHEFWVSPIVDKKWKYTHAKVSYEGSLERGSTGRGIMCVLFNYRTGLWRYSDCSGHHPTVCEEAHKYPDENPKAALKTHNTNKRRTRTHNTNKRRKMHPNTNRRRTRTHNTNRRRTRTHNTNRRRSRTHNTNRRRTRTHNTNKRRSRTHNTNRRRTMPPIIKRQQTMMTTSPTTMPPKKITAAPTHQQKQNVTHAAPKSPIRIPRRTMPTTTSTTTRPKRTTAAQRQQQQQQKSVIHEQCRTGFNLHEHLCFMLVKAHGTVQAEVLCHKHRAVLASFKKGARERSIQSFVKGLTPEDRKDRGVIVAPVKRTKKGVVWLLSNKYAEAALRRNGVVINRLHTVDAIYVPYKGGLHVCQRHSCPRRGLCMAEPTVTYGEQYNGTKVNDDYVNLV